MPSSLDDELRTYLEEERRAREAGATTGVLRSMLQTLTDKVIEHDKEDIRRHAELTTQLGQHHFRIGSLEARQAELAADVEDTGRHNLEELRRKAGRPEDVLWKVVAAVACAVAAGATGLALVHH